MNESRAVLIGIDRGDLDTDESLEELELLVCTLGIEPVERMIQKRSKPDPVGYLGKGKLLKLRELVESAGADMVVADDELTPVQARNIEDITGVVVRDRTQIILEIFARHATTDEGKIQVELAKLQYELPRVVGHGKELSRLGGGIGTRGPGEQLLEQRKREIKRRISYLKKRLRDISTERELQRKRRKDTGYHRVSIVGYTNAGKSSLLNFITGKADARVEDKPFATLEPITRRVKMPSGRVVLFSDTVGFIRKLPHTIIAAFEATLEEVTFSDLLIHTVDISDPNYSGKIKESLKVLEEIGALDIPRILVFNKIDLVPSSYMMRVMDEFPDAVFVSAKRGTGLNELMGRIDDELSGMESSAVVEIESAKLGEVYANLGRVVIKRQEFRDGVAILEISGKADVLDEILGRLK